MKSNRYTSVVILLLVMSIFVMGYGAGRVDQRLQDKENVVLTFSFVDLGWYTVCKRYGNEY